MVAPDVFISNVRVPLVRRATPCWAIFGLVIGTVLVSNAPWSEYTSTSSIPSTTYHIPSSYYSNHHVQHESHHRHVSSFSSTNSSVPELNESLLVPTKSSQINRPQQCPVVPPKLVGPLKVLKEALDWTELESKFPNILPGGCYHTKECQTRTKVALIIPYRDREPHLKAFLHNIHFMLQRQQIDYCIYVVEETKNALFNRAKLFNIGFQEALKHDKYDCFIFHDVDLIPEDDRNLYRCSNQPRHMSVAIDIMRYQLPYESIFGGVSALTYEQMITLNGFSNIYWGWGGEDDDMSRRISYHGFRISRPPAKYARYTMLKHAKDTPNPDRYAKLYAAGRRLKSDGLSNLKYSILAVKKRKLYTWILVDPLQPANIKKFR